MGPHSCASRATMATVMTKVEHRDFSRIAMRRPATLEISGRSLACELIDISLGGALLRVPGRLLSVAGEPCAVTVPLDAAAAVIRMRGQVAHTKDHELGVRCQEIDLDSIVHLRRLVQLNA